MSEEEEEFNRIEREAKQRMEAVSAALDKKAENARELGLDYEPAQYSDIVSDGGMDPRNKFDKPAQQEPVAIALNTGTKQGVKWLKNVEHGKSLYTSPPTLSLAQQDIQRLTALVRAQQITIDKLEAQRTWVGLTDEERAEIAGFAAIDDWHDFEVIDAAEAKLKEKNT